MGFFWEFEFPKGFPTQTIQKSKMSQEEEEENEVHLGLPCGRQKF